MDDCSHLFIALTPNEHCDYPRRALVMMYFPCHVVTTSRVGHYVIHIISTDSKSIMDYSSKKTLHEHISLIMSGNTFVLRSINVF